MLLVVGITCPDKLVFAIQSEGILTMLEHVIAMINMFPALDATIQSRSCLVLSRNLPNVHRVKPHICKQACGVWHLVLKRQAS